jgi:hypothetical protein
MFALTIFIVAFLTALFSQNQYAQIAGSLISIFMFIHYLSLPQDEDDDEQPLVVRDQVEAPISVINSTMGPELPSTTNAADGDIHFLEKDDDVIVYVFDASTGAWVQNDTI